jgi:hypothetical protein
MLSWRRNARRGLAACPFAQSFDPVLLERRQLPVKSSGVGMTRRKLSRSKSSRETGGARRDPEMIGMRAERGSSPVTLWVWQSHWTAASQR